MTDIGQELLDLCAALREVVRPFLGLHAARGHAGVAEGGDVTFDIDEKAEAFLETYMAERLPGWAYYSEDRGLQGAAEPEIVLIVDPIDGTRPAAAGLEAGCVSIAAVPPAAGGPTMGGIVAGVIQEIKSGDVFLAEKGAGFEMRRAAGEPIPFLPSPTVDVEALFWTLGFRGRPAVLLASVLEELIDRSSVKGAVFDIGSATFSITRVLTGQLDAYVDIGPAIIAAHPATEADFRRVGMRRRAQQLALRSGGRLRPLLRGRPADHRRRRRLAGRAAVAGQRRELPDGLHRLEQRRAAVAAGRRRPAGDRGAREQVRGGGGGAPTGAAPATPV